jgi:hypothetical protein
VLIVLEKTIYKLKLQQCQVFVESAVVYEI